MGRNGEKSRPNCGSISPEASFSQWLSGLGKQSQWQQAVQELLSQRQRHDVSASAYNSVIGASGKAAAWILAIALSQANADGSDFAKCCNT